VAAVAAAEAVAVVLASQNKAVYHQAWFSVEVVIISIAVANLC
jgi:hypothetical protein